MPRISMRGRGVRINLVEYRNGGTFAGVTDERLLRRYFYELMEVGSMRLGTEISARSGVVC